ARVEIKGVQSLSSISKVAENEVERQLGLIKIKETLIKRIKIKDLEDIKILDITKNLQSCKSNIVQKLIKDGCAKAIKLPGFKGLLKQKETRLGREFAVHAKLACGIGGIIHSDELPGYGLVEKEVNDLYKIIQINENDAFVIAIGKEIIVDTTLKIVIERAKTSLLGVTNEVRRTLVDDTTEYLRPMPGAARMYPETDVQPIRITKEKIKEIIKNLPEKPDEKHKRFIKQYKLNKEQVKQILSSGYENDFERLVKKYPSLKNIVIRTFLNTYSELEKENMDISIITEEMLSNVFYGLLQEKYAKEAIQVILKYLVVNPKTTIDTAIKNCGLSTTDTKEIEIIVQRIIQEKMDFVKQKGISAVGPLMGIIMKELRGKADGKIISEILLKEIKKIL
ncbi:MAG: Glu-tRNA(Gln) amidotransferase subunit GatE, partial [Candidatus Thermoplasmatota archaeon]|nr:Glu-tRNA(Gln) amidotransferase subunit GatE [Candidatus Thermoplasmatota archaeon]